jgi:hypothetical protein
MSRSPSISDRSRRSIRSCVVGAIRSAGTVSMLQVLQHAHQSLRRRSLLRRLPSFGANTIEQSIDLGNGCRSVRKQQFGRRAAVAEGSGIAAPSPECAAFTPSRNVVGRFGRSAAWDRRAMTSAEVTAFCFTCMSCPVSSKRTAQSPSRAAVGEPSTKQNRPGSRGLHRPVPDSDKATRK